MIDAKFTKKEISSLTITPEDVKKVNEVLKVIEPIEEDITLLGGEKFATGSAVLPVLHKLKKRLAPDENDPSYIARLKEDVLNDMEERCALNLNKKVLSMCSFFDKRFDKLKFLDDDDRRETISNLEEELLALESKLPSDRHLDKEPPKKKRFLGLGFSDSESDGDDHPISIGLQELNRHKLEKRIPSSSCPLEWWRNRRSDYPLLSCLARKYLSVQATSTAAERAMSDMGITLDKRRQAMKEDLFDQLMFLADD